jgi:subtilase family serine protease
MLQGDIFVSRLGVIPARARLAAGETAPEKSNLNIRVKNFTFTAEAGNTEASEFFKKGTKVAVSCSIENSSSEPARNFRTLIRIPGKDVVVKHLKILKAGEEIIISGTLILENTGILYLACRADPDAALFESNENDNHEIAAMYVLPI